MFSTIVYSVLLAFALSDIGGSGLAMVTQGLEKRSSGTDCDSDFNQCDADHPMPSNPTPEQACSSRLEFAKCLSVIKAAIDEEKQHCNKNLFPESVKTSAKVGRFKVPRSACPCCKEAREAISKLEPAKLEASEGGDCPASDGSCMLCKVDVAAVNRTFEDAKTCDKLTDALNKAKKAIAGPGLCTENDLKSYLASRTFVIENAADCHKQECIDLDGELRGNYSLALKVKNGSTEATECHDEGSAAFRIGSAIAPLLGALGIVLITFKIL
ncbi:hypothetical protein Ddc_15748 [Ditylenchus destructor]|nr:hypothetical protein Ddc_15748 [Ditylenchus destructor]